MKGVGDRAPKTHAEVYAREAIYLHEKPEEELKLQAIRIGDLGFAAIPNEVFALTGLKIKAQSPLAHTVNVDLANGAHGYIPPAELHPLGGYTTWPARSAGLEVGAEQKIFDAVVGLLEKVSGKPRSRGSDTHGPYAQAVIDSKPLAYWRLNEWGGPAAADARPAATWRHRTRKACCSTSKAPTRRRSAATGVINRAPHFAGGRMTATSEGARRAPTAYRFWFWNGLATTPAPSPAYLVSRGADGDDSAAGDHLGLAGTAAPEDQRGKLFVYNGNRLGGSLGGRTVIAPRTWNHVVYVRDGKRVSVYLNGAAEPELSGELEPGCPDGVTQMFFAGRNDRLFGLEGKMDEVALYDRALGADEAAAQFRMAGVVPPAP